MKGQRPVFLRISQVARLMNMSRSTIYELAKAGVLPAIQLGSNWRVPSAVIDQLLEKALKDRHDRAA